MNFKERLGRCYELAAIYVIEETTDPYKASVVHGTIQGAGHPPNPHAWVELYTHMGIRIYDAVLERGFSKADWESFANPKEEVRYTYHQLLFNLLEFQNFGPWHS